MNMRILTRFGQYTVILLLLMTLSGFYAVHLGQDSNFDLRNYHWYNAYSFLNHRFDIDIAAASKPTYNNPLLDVVNYALIHLFPKSRRAEFAIGSLHGIGLFFLLNIALIVFKQSPLKWLYAVTAVLVGASGVASLHQIGATYNESQVSMFIMASLFLFTRAIDNRSIHFRDYALAGLVLGVGTALKLTATCYALGMFISLVCYKKWDLTHFKLIFIAGIASLIGFVAIDGFWMWKLYTHFQSPLFPYYNSIFHSPFAGNANLVANEWVPSSIWQGALYPFYWLKKNTITQEFKMKDPRVAVMIVLGLIIVCKQIVQKYVYAKTTVKTEGHETVRFLLMFFCFSFIIWMAQFSIYRFTIPLNFLSGIFIVYFCQCLFKSNKIQLISALVLSILVMQQTISPPWDRKPYLKYFFTLDLPAELPSNALILLSGYRLSYIATFFPRSNKFVGYYNAMIQPNNPGLYHSALKAIQQYKDNGRIYILFFEENTQATNRNLGMVGLALQEDHCQTIKSNLEVTAIKFCPVKEISSKRLV